MIGRMQKRADSCNNFKYKGAWILGILLLLIFSILAFRAKTESTKNAIQHLNEPSAVAKPELFEIDPFDQNMLWYLCMVACLEYCKMKKEKFPTY